MTNVKITYSAFILYTIFLIDICAYFFESNYFTRYMPFVLGLYFIVYCARYSIDYIYLSLVLCISFLTCMLYNQDSSANIITILINLSLGWYLYLNKPNGKIFSVLLLLVFGFFSYKYFINFGIFRPLENALVSGSSNFISIILLSVSILYYTFTYKKYEKVSLWPALGTLFFSIIATGRSGIASSMLLFFGIYFYNVFCVKNSKSVTFLYLTLALIFIGLSYKFANFIYDIDQPTSLLWRFSFDTTETGRKLILREYFSNFSILDLFMGRGNGLIRKSLDMSIHISYIQWHISLGLVAFPIYALVIFAYLRMYMVNKLFFLLMSVLLIRGGTDHVMLTAGFIFGPLLVYYCLLIYFPQNYFPISQGKE